LREPLRPEIAAELAEQAARLTPPARPDDIRRRLVESAEFNIHAGDRERAGVLIEDAISGAAPGLIRARAFHALALLRASTSGLAEAIRLLLAAAEDADDDPLLRATIEIELVIFLYQSGQVRSAEPHAERCFELAKQAGDEAVLALARTISALISFLLGHGYKTEGFGHAVASTPTGPRLSGVPYATWIPFKPEFIEALMQKWGDDFPRARSAFAEQRERLLERHEEASLGPILFQIAELECWAGNWVLAERYGRECRDLTFRWGHHYEALTLTVDASVAALRGQITQARVSAERAIRETEATGDVPFSIRNTALLGFLELSSGNTAAARPFYERAMSMTMSGGYVEPGVFRFQADAIETLVAVMEVEQAEAIVNRLEIQGRKLDRAWALVAAARGKGLLAAADRDLAGATVCLEEALSHHDRLEMPFEQGRTLLLLGGVQRRLKRKRAARDALGQSLRLFERLGANAWAGRARAEIARIGGRAPAPSSLTPTEEQIARLASEGLTNREISESLFMSVKTVERHLAHVFSKLGIESRRELVRRRAGGKGMDGEEG
jgi:DNA-binding CsgD family transcriptional regulator